VNLLDLQNGLRERVRAAAQEMFGVTLEQVEAEASRKREDRGGFDNLLWLDSW